MAEPNENIARLYQLIEAGDAPGVEALLPSLRTHFRQLEYGDFPYYHDGIAGGDRRKRTFLVKPLPSVWDAAISTGHDDVIRALLEGGVNPNRRMANGETALATATRSNSTSILQMLLAAGADPNLRSPTGVSPLHYATLPEVVDQLLQAGAEINVRSDDGDTPVMRREYDGAIDALVHLVRCGANPMTRTTYGQSLLSALCEEANTDLTLDVVEVLVGAGYDVVGAQQRYGDYYAPTNAQVDAYLKSLGATVGHSSQVREEFGVDIERLSEAVDDELYGDAMAILDLFRERASVHEDDWGPEALAAMVSAGYHDGVAELLRMGVNPLNDSTISAENLVSLAVREGHPDIVRLLAEAGARMNSVDSDGLTALQGACLQNDANLVRLLLELGSDVDARDKIGRTALFYARSEEAVRLLVEAGANVNERDADGMTPLFLLSGEDASVISALLDSGADPNARAFVGEAHTTPVLNLLASSIHAGRTKVLQSLIAHGFDLRLHQDGFGDNYLIPLFDMPKGVAVELTRMLLAAGANVNHRDPYGRSPLHHAAAPAAAGPWHDVPIELLVTSGADLEARDDVGDTPLLAAVKVGHGEQPRRTSVFGYGVRHFAKSNAARLGLETTPIPAPDEVAPDVVFRTGVTPPYSPTERLAALGADVNACDAASRTPLIYASTWGSKSAVSALLAAGANVHAEDVLGITPLLAAVNPNTPGGVLGRLEAGIFEALLEAGADPRAVTRLGVSAIDYVSMPHHTDAVYRRLRAQWAEGA